MTITLFGLLQARLNFYNINFVFWLYIYKYITRFTDDLSKIFIKCVHRTYYVIVYPIKNNTEYYYGRSYMYLYIIYVSIL
jgi:hypothetical protein